MSGIRAGGSGLKKVSAVLFALLSVAVSASLLVSCGAGVIGQECPEEIFSCLSALPFGTPGDSGPKEVAVSAGLPDTRAGDVSLCLTGLRTQEGSAWSLSADMNGIRYSFPDILVCSEDTAYVNLDGLLDMAELFGIVFPDVSVCTGRFLPFPLTAVSSVLRNGVSELVRTVSDETAKLLYGRESSDRHYIPEQDMAARDRLIRLSVSPSGSAASRIYEGLEKTLANISGEAEGLAGAWNASDYGVSFGLPEPGTNLALLLFPEDVPGGAEITLDTDGGDLLYGISRGGRSFSVACRPARGGQSVSGTLAVVGSRTLDPGVFFRLLKDNIREMTGTHRESDDLVYDFRTSGDILTVTRTEDIFTETLTYAYRDRSLVSVTASYDTSETYIHEAIERRLLSLGYSKTADTAPTEEYRGLLEFSTESPFLFPLNYAGTSCPEDLALCLYNQDLPLIY